MLAARLPDEGDCWKVKEKHTYPPDVRVHVYEDDYVIDTKKYKMREARPGRGYWRGGAGRKRSPAARRPDLMVACGEMLRCRRR